MEVIIVSFLGAATTVDILSASNADVKLVETPTVLNRRLILREFKKLDRDLSFGKFYQLIPKCAQRW